EDQDVEGIIVLGLRLRDEAVVRRIIDRRIEHTIESQEPGLLIQLILDARAHRDLDESDELIRKILAGRHIMPGMDHRVSAGASARLGRAARKSPATSLSLSSLSYRIVRSNAETEFRPTP